MLEGRGLGAGRWHLWLDALQAVLAGERREDHEPPHAALADGRFRETSPGKGHGLRKAEVTNAYARQLQATSEEA